MTDTIIASLLTSLVTSILTLLVAKYYYSKSLRHARLNNLSSIVNVERSLAQTPTAFKFHGISEEEMKNADIKPDELAYLVANFTAGRIYDTGTYRMSNKPYSHKNYRYKMLEQDPTRRAWPLILRMMTEDEYIKKLTKTKEKIEEKKKYIS